MIRQATAKDIPDILRLYKEGLNELGYTDWKESLLVKKITESFVLAPCFLIENDGIISGMAGMTIVITSHNGVATLMDYMIYIDKNVRNIKVLGGLMDEIKRFADRQNLPVKLEFICNNDEDLRKRLYKQNGFTPFSVTGYYHGHS